jgi:ATP-dependent RNA helicase DOB1
MTTEILRNMIYRGSEIVREVKWVIFDEVHYMRDKERGVVWEETIIMLPSNVKYVFLSATIGNPGQFAMWITKLRKQPCNVVYTDYRPVPLEHYLCPAGGEGLFLAVDDKGKFHDDNFNKALHALGDSGSAVGVDKKKKNLNQGSDLSKIIKTIIERGLDPVIIFSFSKKDVESYAKSICLKYDLTSREEKERIDTVYNRSLMVLDEKDRQLPAIQAMRDIVKKGVGIHHGGLLPLVKEVVELLFQDGLLKVLFSTETFSMGLNMPARTVVFTNVKKFDG